MKRNRVARSAQRGMTLVEIMIVIAIIGLVMGAVVVGAFPAFKKAQCKASWTVAQQVGNAVIAYQTDNSGDCPKSVDELVSGKYLSKSPLDSYGKPVEFKCPGDKNSDGADVWSSGPNKNSGDDDDIKAWEKQDQCNKTK